jgi:uncharacterized DUF497 family protein
MNELTFEWNSRKAESNEAKHGVSFEEAKTVFYDERAIVISDPDHSKIEERFVIMGMRTLSRVLVVVHCIRINSVIRIISARRAGTKEKQPYLKG